MTLQERLDRLYRAMEGQHLLYPTYVPMAHDPWQVDLRQPTPSWWNRYRFYQLGPLRITVDATSGAADANLAYRVSGSQILEIAAWARQRHALPNLHICGSQSPLSPRYPYQHSDIDLVCFIPADELFSDIERWSTIQKQIMREVMPECSRIFGVQADCGFLLEEFRLLPFMMDAADLESPQAIEQWDLDLEQVVTILEQRWQAFVTQQDVVQRDCRRAVAMVQQILGASSTVQIVSEARWDDVVPL